MGLGLTVPFGADSQFRGRCRLRPISAAAKQQCHKIQKNRPLFRRGNTETHFLHTFTSYFTGKQALPAPNEAEKVEEPTL
jgi:hypothetical protein